MTRAANILFVDSDRSRVRQPAHAFSGRAGLSSSARAGSALVLANVRYWSTVAPLVRGQLARWNERAQAIPDPSLRTLATSKLRDEHFNAQVAATLATLSPRAQRARVVEAIVALQVLYDYLDVLTEQPATTSLDATLLFTALSDAVATPLEQRHDSTTAEATVRSSDSFHRDYYVEGTRTDDGGYLQALVGTVNSALARLPAATAVTPVAQRAAARCAEAQLLNHQASRSGIDQLRKWATDRAAGTDLGWQQFLAGATASVLAIGALIAAAADPTTTLEDAEELDRLYLSIGALTMLDSLVDLQEDLAVGRLGYVQYYDDPEAMASGLARVARDAVARARRVPNGAHHVVTLVGIVAYYASAPAASAPSAREVISRVRRELRPLITPTLALMRGWRAAKRVRNRGRHGAARV